jgi:integrase
MVLRPGFEPGSTGWMGHAVRVDIQSLEEFGKFLKVDLGLAEKTVWRYVYEMEKFFGCCEKQPITRVLLRDYLEPLEVEPRNTALKAFRRFFRDFVGRGELVSSFRFIKRPPKLRINLPTKEGLRRAFDALETLRDRVLLLLYASSGLRRQEILDLTFDDVDFGKRMLVPNRNSRTKHAYVSFYNEEAEKILEEYLQKNRLGPMLFPVTWNAYHKAQRKVYRRTGVKVNPQILRDWFCNEMGELSVPDRYIDAFCGRVPRSILARHYTDYSPKRLKAIYDKANLKVLA